MARGRQLPIGMSFLLMALRDRKPVEAAKIHRQSKRTFRWRIIDEKWDGDAEAGTGVTTTFVGAEKAAERAWRNP